MTRDYVGCLIIAIVLMAVGLLFGRWLVATTPATVNDIEGSAPAFRNWLWRQRSLDLLTQVSLIFAGALGVAALLPDQEETPPAKPSPGDLLEESP